MTNEEKAVKLALERYPERLTPDREFDLYENDRHIFIQGALDMAEWKDGQFKEYLEKKIHTIESMKDIDTTLPTDTAIVRTINEIINEFFGENRTR